MADTRITYLRNKTYNTKSNKIRKLRLPGGRLSVQYIKRASKGPQTYFKTKSRLSGLKRLRNPEYLALSKSQRRISRPYGGVLTPSEVKEKILRAFLVEEVKLVKELVRTNKKKSEKTKPVKTDKSKADKTKDQKKVKSSKKN